MGPATLGGGLAAIVIAGAATGVVLERTGAVDVLADPDVQVTLDAVPYAACPGQDIVGDLHRGDRVFLTGRNSDGTWLELRAPYDTTRRVWVETEWIVPDDSVSALPTVTCSEPLSAESGSTASTVAPSSDEPATSIPPTTTTTSDPAHATSTTAATDSSSPSTSEVPPAVTTSTAPPPTSSTTTTSTTTATSSPPPSASSTTSTTTTTTSAPADVAGPSIDAIGADPLDIWEDAAFGGCPTQSHVTTVSVLVSDSGGVADVQLRYDTGVGPETDTMVAVGAGRFEAELGPFGEDEVGADTPVTLTVVATDIAGNTSTASETAAFVLHHCSIG